MNEYISKYVKSDVRNAIALFIAATNNVIASIERGETDRYEFEKHYPLSLIHEVMKSRGYSISIPQHYVTDTLRTLYVSEKEKVWVIYMTKTGGLFVRKEI